MRTHVAKLLAVFGAVCVVVCVAGLAHTDDPPSAPAGSPESAARPASQPAFVAGEIVERFLRDNREFNVTVRLPEYHAQRDALYLRVVLAELEPAAWAAALRDDTRPLPEPLDIRVWSISRDAEVLLSGDRYALVVGVDTLGLGLGLGEVHRFQNPRLARLIEGVLAKDEQLDPHTLRLLQHGLRIAAGEIGLDEPLPPAPPGWRGRHSPASPASRPAQQGAASQENLVLAGVRQYYRQNGWSVPGRIVIAQKHSDVWLVYAGPEIKEAAMDVDPHTGRVLRFRPGQ